ncbi:MAG: hypothetical protein ACYDHO_00640 [Gaiellaceae bacterium]
MRWLTEGGRSFRQARTSSAPVALIVFAVSALSLSLIAVAVGRVLGA